MGDYSESSYGSSYTSLMGQNAKSRFGCILIGRNLDYDNEGNGSPTLGMPKLTALMDLSDKRCGGHGEFWAASSLGLDTGNWGDPLQEIIFDIQPNTGQPQPFTNAREYRDNFDTFFDRIVTVAKNHAYAQGTSALEQTV